MKMTQVLASDDKKLKNGNFYVHATKRDLVYNEYSSTNLTA